MGSNRKERVNQVLESEEAAVTDRDKSEMMVKAFVQIHGSGNLTETEGGENSARK